MYTPARRRVSTDRRVQRSSARQAASVAAAPPLALALRLPIQGVLTVELAAYAAIFVLGLAVRIGHLDAYPLASDEAVRAMSGLQMVRGETLSLWQEPLVVSLAALSFLVLGDNDVMARLIPVAAGSALVLLPWLFKAQIGRFGALAAALFLSISPTFVFYSRTLSGDALAAALSLGLLYCINRYVAARQGQWVAVGASLIALLLNAGSAGIAFLLPFIAFFAVVAALGKSANDYKQAWETLKADRETLKLSATMLIGGFVLLGTSFFVQLSGLKLPALAAWVFEFNIVPDGKPWYFHLLALLAYEPLILVFGVAGAAYSLYRWQKSGGRQALGMRSFLMFWVVVSLAASAFTGIKHGGQLLGIALPLALLAGSLAGEIIGKVGRQLDQTGRWLLIGSTPFLVYAVLVVSDLTRRDQAAFWYQWTLALLALALAVTMVAAAIAHGGHNLGRAAALAALALLLGYSVHATWRTVYATSEAEPLVPTLTSPALVDAMEEIELYAASRFLGKGVTVAVEPELREPIEWYLRNYDSVQFTTKPSQGTQAIIWRVEQPPADIKLEEYSARKARLSTTWSGKGGGLREAWRWLMYRERFGVTQDTQMMLYLRK